MIYVVTAVHNRKKITKRFIDGLKSQTTETKIHFLVIDDGSTDGTAKMVKMEYPMSTVLYGDGNLFWGGALHMAFQYLSKKPIKDDDIVLLINDDSRLSENYLELLQEILKSNPNDLVTGCAYGITTGYYLDGPVNFNLQTSEVTLLPAGSTGNCASTRALGMYGKVFKEIGGFHPILLPHYASDYEYTIRAYKKGHKIISAADLKYTFSEDTTGDNSHKNLSIKKILSKRSKLNPFYKLSFFLMIAPVYRLPAFICFQVKHFGSHKRDDGKAV